MNVLCSVIVYRVGHWPGAYKQSVKNILSSSLPSTNIKTNRAIIVTVVLYGCVTCSVIMKKEHRLRVLENGVQRKTFGPKMHKVTRGWRRSHTE